MPISLNERHMSAMSLRIYQLCPLRFKFRYLDGLYLNQPYAAKAEDRKAIERGEHFHLMARRYYAGLDPATVADPVEQRELDHWLGLLQGFLPRTFDRSFYPELELRLNRPDMRLMAKFDLVVVDPDGRAVIFDWKTERRMPKRQYLLKSMQTLVYRYMLCAAGGAYSPIGQFKREQISMIYWNPIYPHKWERLDYSKAQYRLDEEYLQQQIARIRATAPDRFTATPEEAVCARCEYQMLCHGRRAEALEADEQEWLDDEALTWDRLPDLP